MEQEKKEKEMLSGKNLVLFGEIHTVNEKYDEIKKVIFDAIEQKPYIKNVTVFLELPYSFQYALDLFINSGDTTVLSSYFMDHSSYKKSSEPSSTWVGFKNWIYDVTHYAQEMGININYKSVDFERLPRRTAFILSEFFKEKEVDVHLKKPIDSLLDTKYIMNTLEVSDLLTCQINKALQTHPLSDEDVQFLSTIRTGLSIDSIFCQTRETHMYNNFINHYTSDSSYLFFGKFGLAHVFRDYMHECDALLSTFSCAVKSDKKYKPFIMLLPDEIIQNTYIVGINVLNACNTEFQGYKFGPIKKRMHSALPSEEEYLRSIVPKDSVLRIHTKEIEELKSYARYVDYLIVYYCSNYK